MPALPTAASSELVPQGPSDGADHYGGEGRGLPLLRQEPGPGRQVRHPGPPGGAKTSHSTAAAQVVSSMARSTQSHQGIV